MIDTRTLVRMVHESQDPLGAASGIIGAMTAVIRVYRSEEFAADFLRSAADRILPARTAAEPDHTLTEI